MTAQSPTLQKLKRLLDQQTSDEVVEVSPSFLIALSDEFKTLEDPRRFLDDLIPREEASRELGMKKESMSVAHRTGRLPLTRYKRGRETYYSLREIVAYLRATSIEKHQTRVLKRHKPAA